MEAISFVRDMGLVLRCNNLEESTRELEKIARHAVDRRDSNKVEFEMKVTLFSRQRKTLQQSREANTRSGNLRSPSTVERPDELPIVPLAVCEVTVSRGAMMILLQLSGKLTHPNPLIDKISEATLAYVYLTIPSR